MKKYFLFMFLWGMSMFGFALTQPGAMPRFATMWAALKDGGAPTQEQLTRAEEQVDNGQTLDLSEKTTLLPRILKGKPIRVWISLPPEELGNSVEKAYYEGLVKEAFENWFDGTNWHVQQRCKEDKVCLKELTQKGLEEKQLVFVPEGAEADLWVYVQDDLKIFREYICENELCVGLFKKGNSYDPMSIYVPNQKAVDAWPQTQDREQMDVITTWIHEVGHALGLADMYPAGFEQGASQVVCSVSQNRNLSVMNSGSSSLGCEDADGLINLADLWTIYFAKAEHGPNFEQYLPERLKKGWQSFCPAAEWYKPLEMAKKIEEGAL